MGMNRLTYEDKKIFFEGLQYIQTEYNRIYKKYSFEKAEEFKKFKIKEYLKNNKEKLLSIYDKLF